MSKIVIGVLSGIFIGAVLYELLDRYNPELIKKVEELASRKIDELSDVRSEVAA